MRIRHELLKRYLGCAALLLGAGSASAHISYTNRDFGTLVPNAAPVTISNQTVNGNYGWADGTDDDNADSHKVRYYRFTLAAPAYVTLSFSGSTNGGTRDGTIKPGFSIYQGLAHVAPITTAPGSADYDTSAISMAYRAQLETTLGHPVEGCFHALKDWRIGGDNQPGPTFDFDAADGLSTFVFKGYAADGDSTLFGSAPGVIGDGNADGTITKSIYLQAGNYTVAVGGVNYAGQTPTPDATIYGLVGTISASVFTYTAGDVAAGGIGYQHQVVLGGNSAGSFSSHVGAWSWEDESLFDSGAGEPPVGWTHTSNWLALTIQQDCVLTVTMKRDAAVPWASGANGLADTSSMFPSFTLWRGQDNDLMPAAVATDLGYTPVDANDHHTYNNRGNVVWAEDLSYMHHADNSTETEITRTYYLPAGQYTMALGSNAPSTNALRQGFNISFSTKKSGAVDPVAVDAGIGYAHTIVVNAGDQDNFSAHVGAWSWEDNDLFDANAGEPPVGWTHTSQWAALNLKQEVLFTIKMERDAAVPWTGVGNLGGFADISSMFPSFTLFRGWDNDQVPADFKTRPDVVAAWAPYGGVPADLGDWHTYNNRGRVVWAEDLSYIDHVDNSTSPTISRTYRLPAGLYSLVMGSNAPATNTLRQGFKLSYSAVAVTSNVITGDPQAGGIGYAYTLTAGAGETGTIKDHTGAWSWEDQGIAPGGGEGWTHTSKWVALNLKQPCTFSITMARDATVPYSGTGNVGGFAAVDHLFPSMTIYRGWDNDLMPAEVATQLSYLDPLTANDHHTYANRANVIWAEDLSYLDHIDNSTAETVTRSWTLPAGNYSLALGSNSPSDTSPPRQGFRFTFTTSAPQFVPPVITKQPKSLVLNAGLKAVFTVAATGPGVTYQWQKDGDDIDGETLPTLTLDPVSPADADDYRCVVRNAAAVIASDVASLTVVSKPDVTGPLNLPDAMLGELINVQVTATNNPTAFKLTGKLPTGVIFNAKTGLLLGRPTTTGSFTVTIVASNGAGTGIPQSDTFVVNSLTTGAVGSYTGAIGRSASLNEFLGGCITLNTLPTGGLTGNLKLGKKNYPLTGALSVPALTGNIVVPRVGMPAITLAFTINAAAGTVTGTLTDGLSTVPFSARQAEKVPGTLVGNYTTALQLDPNDKGNDAIPQGHSFGGFKIAATGAVTGAITLADKSVVTLAGPIEKGGNLTVFKLLYANAGSFLAVLNIDSTDSFNLVDSEASWLKLAEPTASKGRLYKAGFGPLELSAIGRKYVIPASGIALDLAANAAGNAKIAFAEGGLASATTNPNADSIVITAGSPKVTTVLAPNPGIVALTVTPGSGAATTFVSGTTGSIKGSFQLIDADTTVTPNKPLTRKADYQGMIVDDGAGQKAYGFFILAEMPSAGPPKTTLLTSKQLSGSVLLEAK